MIRPSPKRQREFALRMRPGKLARSRGVFPRPARARLIPFAQTRTGCGSRHRPPCERARGTPDARCVRSPVCKKVKAHECRRHESTGHIRRSARDGFNGLLREYPRCSTLGLNHRSRGLTRRRLPSVRGASLGAAPWRKAMRRDLALWAVRRGVVVSLPSHAPAGLSANHHAPRRIERRGVHRIPPRRP
jgi:hypothetical protein